MWSKIKVVKKEYIKICVSSSSVAGNSRLQCGHVLLTLVTLAQQQQPVSYYD